MGGKTVHTPKKKTFSLGRKPNNLKIFMKNPLHSLQVANSTPKNSRKKRFLLTSFCCVLQKFHPKKNPSKVHLPKSAKNGHFKSATKNQTHQLLLWTKKLGGLATLGPTKLFGAQHHPDEFGFLAKPQFVHPKKTQQEFWRKKLWGLVWFDWLVGVVGWLVEVVWLKWFGCGEAVTWGTLRTREGWTRNGNA